MRNGSRVARVQCWVPELVFGHAIQGPLKVLKENILEIEASPKTNVLNYELEVLESIYITLVTWQKNRLQLRKKS